MRVVLMAMFVMLAAPDAEACPHGTVCVSAETRSQVREATQVVAVATPRVEEAHREIPAERRTDRSMLHVAIANAERGHGANLEAARLSASLRTHVAPRARTVEMPWIWVQLRRSVYDRMPRYERVSRRVENRFSLTLSPVVVSSPQDTVPGVGIEGDF